MSIKLEKDILERLRKMLELAVPPDTEGNYVLKINANYVKQALQPKPNLKQQCK